MIERYVNKLNKHRFIGRNDFAEIRLIRPMNCYYHNSILSIDFQISSVGYGGRLDSEVVSVDIPDDGKDNLKNIQNIKRVIKRCLKDYKAKGISRAQYRKKLGHLGDAF